MSKILLLVFAGILYASHAAPINEHLTATVERHENMDRAVNAPEGFLPVFAKSYHGCPVFHFF